MFLTVFNLVEEINYYFIYKVTTPNGTNGVDCYKLSVFFFFILPTSKHRLWSKEFRSDHMQNAEDGRIYKRIPF